MKMKKIPFKFQERFRTLTSPWKYYGIFTRFTNRKKKANCDKKGVKKLVNIKGGEEIRAKPNRRNHIK
jgi:hypothetical protein